MAAKWSIKLNSGANLPAFGLGTSRVKSGSVIDVAIRAGYRHIDGAIIYRNEKEIGEALQTLYKEGVVKREDLFITSKLSAFQQQSAKENVLKSCQAVLKDLQTNYLDLFLIHGPCPLKEGAVISRLKDGDVVPYSEAMIASVWEGMEELVQRGMVRSIGVSNFSMTKTANLLKTAKIVPAVNQVECHVYFQQPKLRAYMKSKGIAVQAYAPLGSPSRRLIDPNDPVLLEDPVVNEIASKHQATAAQVCISFLLHVGVSPIPKSGTESRIIENMKACELVLSDDELDRIRELDRNLRLFKTDQLLKVPDYFNPVEDEMFQ